LRFVVGIRASFQVREDWFSRALVLFGEEDVGRKKTYRIEGKKKKPEGNTLTVLAWVDGETWGLLAQDEKIDLQT